MSVKPAELTIRPQEPKTESFLPGDFLGATTQAVPALSRPLHTLICQYGYEILPRDLIGRVEVTFDGQKRWLFFFQAERMQKVFQAVLAFGEQDPETTLAMRNCILLAMHTTYQPRINSDVPLARLFTNVNCPFVEFDGHVVEKGIKNSRLMVAQALIMTSSTCAALERMRIPVSPRQEQQRFLAVKSFLDENRLFCGSSDETTVSLAHEETELYHPIVVESSRLGGLSIATPNEKREAPKPEGDEQGKAQGK